MVDFDKLIKEKEIQEASEKPHEYMVEKGRKDLTVVELEAFEKLVDVAQSNAIEHKVMIQLKYKGNEILVDARSLENDGKIVERLDQLINIASRPVTSSFPLPSHIPPKLDQSIVPETSQQKLDLNISFENVVKILRDSEVDLTDLTINEDSENIYVKAKTYLGKPLWAKINEMLKNEFNAVWILKEGWKIQK